MENLTRLEKIANELAETLRPLVTKEKVEALIAFDKWKEEHSEKTESLSQAKYAERVPSPHRKDW